MTRRTASRRTSSYNSGGNTNTYWDFGDIGAGGRVSIPNPTGTETNWTHYALVACQSGHFMKILVNGQQVVSNATFNAFETTVASTLRIGGGTGFFSTAVWTSSGCGTWLAARPRSSGTWAGRSAATRQGCSCTSNSTRAPAPLR